MTHEMVDFPPEQPPLAFNLDYDPTRLEINWSAGQDCDPMPAQVELSPNPAGESEAPYRLVIRSLGVAGDCESFPIGHRIELVLGAPIRAEDIELVID